MTFKEQLSLGVTHDTVSFSSSSLGKRLTPERPNESTQLKFGVNHTPAGKPGGGSAEARVSFLSLQSGGVTELYGDVCGKGQSCPG